MTLKSQEKTSQDKHSNNQDRNKTKMAETKEEEIATMTPDKQTQKSPAMPGFLSYLEQT